MAGELSLLSLLPAGLALAASGVAWGVAKARLEALERRMDKSDCSESKTDLEVIGGNVERHEAVLHTLVRHMGDLEQAVAVLKDRTERKP